MRGFNGVYIRKGDVKQASITRCEQIDDTDELVFNGNSFTFFELKYMWLKEPIGWKFDDIAKQKEKLEKEK